MKSINADEFKDVKNGIVDFWADWCGPCKELMPVLEKLENEFDVDFFKIEAPNAKDLTAELGIMGIPCVLLIKEGNEVDRCIGKVDEETLRSKINEVFG